MWRVRAGAEGPRRAAAGASKAARRAGTREGATPLGHTPALAALARGQRQAVGACGQRLRQVQHHARWGGPRAGARFSACVGSPRCSHIERTPAGPSPTPAPFACLHTAHRRSPSSAKVLRSSPAPSTRALLCFLGSSTVAARQRLSFRGPASVPA